MRFKDFTAKATNNGGFGRFIGYAATFDRKPDTYGDVIAKGAFAGTIRARGGLNPPRARVLRPQHGRPRPLDYQSDRHCAKIK